VSPPANLDRALSAARTQHGTSLRALSDERALLVVLLRPLGCTFSRQTLADLAAGRPEIEAARAGLVLVHMAPDPPAAALFARYGLDDLPRVSDPARALYRAFHLVETSLAQLVTRDVLAQGARAWRDGHRPGRLHGDVRQMPGAFLVYRGDIADAIRHETVADRPNYVAFVRGG
jgi:hypothetical protein